MRTLFATCPPMMLVPGDPRDDTAASLVSQYLGRELVPDLIRGQEVAELPGGRGADTPDTDSAAQGETP